MEKATQPNFVPICAVVYVEDKGLEVVPAGDVICDLDSLLKAYSLPYDDTGGAMYPTMGKGLKAPAKLSIFGLTETSLTQDTQKVVRGRHSGRPHIFVFSERFKTIDELMQSISGFLENQSELEQKAWMGNWEPLKIALMAKYNVRDGIDQGIY